MAVSTRHIELELPEDVGSGITARRFLGGTTNEEVQVGSPPDASGDMTMAVLFRKLTAGSSWVMHTMTSANGLVWTLGTGADNRPGLVNLLTTATNATGTTILPTDGWVILVAKRSAGTTTPRFHVYKNGAWTSFDATSTLGNGASQVGGKIRFATVAGSTWYHCDIAVAAQWSRKLSDHEVTQLLAPSWATRDFMGLDPAGCWEFDQAAVTDAVTDLAVGGSADEISRTGSRVITDGPTAFQYVPPLGSPIASGTFYTAAMALGPELYWRLGESAGQAVTDISGNEHHGEYIANAAPQATGLLSGDSDKAASLNRSAGSVIRALEYKPFQPGTVRSFVALLKHTSDTSGAIFAADNNRQPLTYVISGSVPGTLTVVDTTGADGSPAFPASASGTLGLVGSNGGYSYTSKDATHLYGVSGGTLTPGVLTPVTVGIANYPALFYASGSTVRFYPNVDTLFGGWADIDLGSDAEVNDTLILGFVYNDATGLADFWVNGVYKGQLGPTGALSVAFDYDPIDNSGVFQFGNRGPADSTTAFEGTGDEILVYESALDNADMIALATAAGLYSSDTTPPTPLILSGPTATKISRVAGKDSTQFTWESDEDFQSYKIKVVPSSGTAHTGGTLIEQDENPTSGGAAGTDYTATISDDELVAAGAAEGSNIVKIFIQDSAGNWSA